MNDDDDGKIWNNDFHGLPKYDCNHVQSCFEGFGWTDCLQCDFCIKTEPPRQLPNRPPTARSSEFGVLQFHLPTPQACLGSKQELSCAHYARFGTSMLPLLLSLTSICAVASMASASKVETIHCRAWAEDDTQQHHCCSSHRQKPPIELVKLLVIQVASLGCGCCSRRETEAQTKHEKGPQIWGQYHLPRAIFAAPSFCNLFCREVKEWRPTPSGWSGCSLRAAGAELAPDWQTKLHSWSSCPACLVAFCLSI